MEPLPLVGRGVSKWGTGGRLDRASGARLARGISGACHAELLAEDLIDVPRIAGGIRAGHGSWQGVWDCDAA